MMNCRYGLRGGIGGRDNPEGGKLLGGSAVSTPGLEGGGAEIWRRLDMAHHLHSLDLLSVT